MPVEVFTNDGLGTVSAGGTSAPAPGTSEAWTVSVTNAFPAASASATPPAVFYVCDQAAAQETEKILVTNISGATWTVTRGADGTTPVAHTAGFTIVQVITRASLQVLQRPWLVRPSGDATGAQDTAAINASLTAYEQTETVPGATYTINAPVVVPPRSVLSGAGGSWANTGGQGTPAGPVTVIKAAAAFAGNGMVIVQDAILGGYATQANNVQIRSVALDGSAASGAVAGLYLNGPVWGLTLADLGIYKMPGNGITTQGDAANYPTGQNAPYGIHATRVKVDTCAGAGIVLGNTTDSHWHMVQVIGCTGNGWNFNSSGDHRITASSAEFCAIGFNMTCGGVQLDTCRTDANVSHGVSGVTGSTGDLPVLISNCAFRRDGTNGTDKGININNPLFPVFISNTTVNPSSGSTTPATAFAAAGASTPMISVSNSLFWGVTTGTSITATNFHNRTMYTRTGSNASPSAITLVADA